MSSFGSGGGSISNQTGYGLNPKTVLGGLDFNTLTRSLGQQLQQGAGAPSSGVQPGQMASMSPQQRLASVMRQYQGGNG